MIQTVELTPQEMHKGYFIASQWRTVSDPTYKPKWGQRPEDMLENTILGVLCELAVAKYLGVEYDGDIGIAGDVDVGGAVEVRGTENQSSDLPLHPEDKNLPYILVIRYEDTFKLIGWIMAPDGQKDEFWNDRIPRPCYFVPQIFLQPMELLPIKRKKPKEQLKLI